MIRFQFAFVITTAVMYGIVGCSSSEQATSGTPSPTENFVSSDDYSPAPEASRGMLSDVDSVDMATSEVSKATPAASASYGSDSPVTPPEHREPERPREKPFQPNNAMQSGLLTAGSFDDVANYGEYASFIERHRHQMTTRQLPLNANSYPTVITVTDGQNRPVGDIRCVVKAAPIGQQQREQTLLDTCTGSDGRVLLFTDTSRFRYPQSPRPKVRLQLFRNGNSEPIVDDVRHVDSRWDITVNQVESCLPTQLDLALVVDTTGSMGDELSYLKAEIDSIVASVHRMFPNVDQRYSLITYRDNGDEYVTRNYDFTSSLDEFRRTLDKQTAQGGGDFPEAMDVALTSAEQLSWRQQNTARVMFLVGDAPPRQGNVGTTMSAIQSLRQKGIRMFPIGASGVDTNAQIVMRTASLLTMGQYLFLTDHSGVGNPHATPEVSRFAVERLDRLMIRMIASELAGKRLVPDEVIAIEQGERYTIAAPIPPCQPVAIATPPVCAVPVQTPVPRCVIVEPASQPLSCATVFSWIGGGGIGVLLALFSAVFVFDNLAALGSRLG